MYEDCPLTLDRIGAEWSARFRAQVHRSGQILDLGDALIAGTARAHNLTIATRNVSDFRYVAIDVPNPWDPRP